MRIVVADRAGQTRSTHDKYRSVGCAGLQEEFDFIDLDSVQYCCERSDGVNPSRAAIQNHQVVINRGKTRIITLKKEGASLDFLGYTFRYERDEFGRDKRFLNMVPSAKSCARERKAIRGIINTRSSFVPIPELIKQINKQLCGWSAYYNKGRSRPALRAMNWFVFRRVVKHLKRRSQRPYRPPEGVTWYEHVYRRLGLIQL